MIASMFRMMTIALAVSASPQVNLSVPHDILSNQAWPWFNNYMTVYNKSYTVDEFRGRFYTFAENLDHLYWTKETYNHDVRINQYADLSIHEFEDKVGAGCYKVNHQHATCVKYYVPTEQDLQSLPDSVDWRDNNVVTPVKNQKKCGSCWSFSATGALEGAWALATGNLLSLSEQQLLDCSVNYGDHACNGGMMEDAFAYAIDHGMCSETEDPYEAAQGTCKQCTPVANFSSCYSVQPNNQLHLKAAVARGPVSVAIEADTTLFQFYSGGVLDSANCGTALDHGVLAVGYGEEDGKKYWLVKNSWGPSWGDNGYIKIARTESENDGGVCGIAMQPAFPVAHHYRSENHENSENREESKKVKYAICNRWADVLDT